jgi:hypothetical protein
VVERRQLGGGVGQLCGRQGWQASGRVRKEERESAGRDEGTLCCAF